MITNSVNETVETGRDFAKTLNTYDVILMYGEMGVGKTHFVKGMAQGLGITENVTSPTFALINEYPGLYHFDLFRISSIDDLYAIGFYDYIGKGIIAIEWSENIPDLEQEFDKYYKIEIIKKDENTREIIINDYSRS
ncbi:MAG: tRNA (adenosine(37)-N6)-threonylcarbamoyltransferase complex ATPase subunit type 1 TsaE [Oscillospiraceae bacterium]|nr:tRNA (adenosine(37)-N6)-threonylcarbamoyltransferase complex ATPase subunit type 1 TsaE [Oscillospiraceae bacterium]